MFIFLLNKYDTLCWLKQLIYKFIINTYDITKFNKRCQWNLLTYLISSQNQHMSWMIIILNLCVWWYTAAVSISYCRQIHYKLAFVIETPSTSCIVFHAHNIRKNVYIKISRLTRILKFIDRYYYIINTITKFLCCYMNLDI